MANKSSKNKKKLNRGAQSAAAEENQAHTAPPAAASLGTRRVARKKVPETSGKERTALAKQAARANFASRMTAEGR